jgi:hypothetical protein
MNALEALFHSWGRRRLAGKPDPPSVTLWELLDVRQVWQK